MVNEVQTIDHFLGEMYPDADTLGHVTVSGPSGRGGPVVRGAA